MDNEKYQQDLTNVHQKVLEMTSKSFGDPEKMRINTGIIQTIQPDYYPQTEWLDDLKQILTMIQVLINDTVDEPEKSQNYMHVLQALQEIVEREEKK